MQLKSASNYVTKKLVEEPHSVLKLVVKMIKLGGLLQNSMLHLYVSILL